MIRDLDRATAARHDAAPLSACLPDGSNVLKHSAASELPHAARIIAGGGRYIDEALDPAQLRAGPLARVPKPADAAIPPLESQEEQVLPGAEHS